MAVMQGGEAAEVGDGGAGVDERRREWLRPWSKCFAALTAPSLLIAGAISAERSRVSGVCTLPSASVSVSAVGVGPSGSTPMSGPSARAFRANFQSGPAGRLLRQPQRLPVQ